jgi:uncharacterized protein YciI
VNFFVYSRDAAGVDALRDDDDLLEEHWSYMDRFADTMIARGPTLTPDRERATGSLHVLGLANEVEARTFVEREPNNRAGVYADHRIWEFDDLLGRTMWEFSSAGDQPRFLVIALHPAPVPQVAALHERLILHGALREPGGDVLGLALALEAPSRDDVLPLLQLGAVPHIEVHDWEFGGRR